MTMNTKFGIGAVFTTILIVTVVLMPIVSAQKNATEELTFGPGTLDVLKKDPNFIAAHGSIPTFSTSDERKQWLNTIDKLYTNFNKDYKKGILKHLYPNGPVIAYGYSIDGILQVVIEKGQKISPANQNEIYNLFSNCGQKINVKNTPLVFVYGNFPVQTSRSSSWRPLIGGIQIISDGNGSPATSTLGFAAKTNSGTKGFVVSEHAAPFIGSGVYQPTASSYVGSVTKYSNAAADASWVPSSNVNAQIYEYDTNQLRTVTSYGDPAVGDLVYKSGIVTGETAGYVSVKESVYNNGLGKYLDGQCVAGYQCDSGDSGSPVFYPLYGTTNAKIHGIHWGGMGTYTPGYGYSTSVFSPVSGIHNDLGVYPLTA